MPKGQFPVQVVENRELGGGYFELRVESSAANPVHEGQPGQFVMLRGDWGRDLINGRAFSIHRVFADNTFSIVAKPFGRGTQRMAAMEVGDRLTCTGPLGKAFPLAMHGVRDILVAGGVGLPPLHFYARRARREGRAAQVEMYYAGRSAAEIVLQEETQSFGIELTVATEDGSAGVKGRVTEPLVQALQRHQGKQIRILACGPTPMLKAIRTIALERDIQAFLCLEEQMACGFGVCLGCAVPVYGDKPYQYCCVDGPVFAAQEVRWS